MAEVTLEINSKAHNVPTLAAALRGVMQSLDVSRADAEQIVLGAVETINNSVRHAYGNDRSGIVRLGCTVHRSPPEKLDIVITVSDKGPPLEPPDRPELPGPDSESGRGWFIINACFDRVDYHRSDGTNTILLHKSMAQPAPGAVPAAAGC